MSPAATGAPWLLSVPIHVSCGLSSLNVAWKKKKRKKEQEQEQEEE